MVRTTSTIEKEEDDIRGIRDIGASSKRKEDQLPFNSGKKQKISVSHGSWGQGRGHQGQGQGQLYEGGGHFRTLSSVRAGSIPLPPS